MKAMKKLGMNALLGVGQGSRARQPRRGHALERRQEGRRAGRLHRQGRVLRHRRHLDQAGRRHGGHEGRHGGRGLRGRPDARARRAQGARSTRSASSAWSRTCRTATRSGRATSSPRCPARPSRSSTPTPKAASCWPTCCTTSTKRFKPKFMIDLATLTGAIIVALGQEYAGLFSNDDKLCRAADQGRARRPASGSGACRSAPEYDKMIDSKFADMKNTGGRYGGSITAAQFLQRFVGQDAVGASRHRRHRAGLAADRHQQELGLGLGRAAARPAGGGSLREVRDAPAFVRFWGQYARLAA